MKQPENNEIDSLLRSWAGRRRSVSTELAENGAGVHMDADELNSYAEGALSLSTRARYTAHLADCDDCRKLVAQLAVAAGPMINERAIGQQRETAGWRKALTAFFAPSVMRYALPALALVIIGVFFFASRRQNERASVALTTQTETKPAIEPSKQTAAETLHNDDRTAADQTRVAPSQVSRAAQAGAGKEKEQKASNAPAASTEAGKQQEEQKKETASIAAKERRPDAVAQPAEAPPPAAAKPASSATPKDKNIVIDALADMKEAGARKREPARPA